MNYSVINRTADTWLLALILSCMMAILASAQTLTVLPEAPMVGGLDNTGVEVQSTSNFVVTYDLDSSVNPWEGAWVLLPNPVDFSSETEFVFGIHGDPELITVEFKDDIGGVTVIASPTITSDFEYWVIDATDVDNTDLSQLKELVFVVHTWSHGGAASGQYSVYLDGLDFSTTELTVLPAPPTVGGLDNTGVEVQSTTNLVVTYDLNSSVNPWEGAWVLLPDPVDFSSATEFVFGIQGDPDLITVEFKDATGGVTVITSPTITSDFQFWVIDAADVDSTDLSQLSELVFVVHTWSHGDAAAGTYNVHIGGLDPDAEPPAPPELTVLPAPPMVGGLDNTGVEVQSTTNLVVTYDLNSSVNPWEGAWVLLPDPVDFSSATEFVFGIQGDPDLITVEFKDATGGVTVITSPTITSDFQFWIIDTADVDSTDLSQLTELVFVVHTWSHGDAAAGTYNVHIGGLDPAPPAPPELTVLPTSPLVGGLDNTGVEVQSTTNILVSYDLNSSVNPWEGAWMVLEDPADFSGITEFVFGISGDPNLITVEIKDAIGGVTVIQSPTITSEFQFWVIDVADVDNTDLSQLKELVFIVHDWSHGGAAAGTYSVHIGGLDFDPPEEPLSADPSDPSETSITILPGEPTLGEIAGTDFEHHSSTNFTVNYDVTVDPFFAATIVQWPEPTNLTAITEFVFGVRGTPDTIKVEFEDGDGGKTTIVLNSVTDDLQHWVIDASLVENLDSLKAILFVVDEGAAGAGNLAGAFEVFVGGLAFSPPELTVLPESPLIGGLDNTGVEVHSTSNFVVSYNLNTSVNPWEGAWLVFDEAIDMSSVSELVFGIRGDPDLITVEIKDAIGGTTVIQSPVITDDFQFWIIDAADIDNTDMSQLKELVFIVHDWSHGGAAEGQYTVYVGGLDYTPPVPELTVLPPTPLVGGLDNTGVEVLSTTNFVVSYDLNTSVNPWEGAWVVLPSPADFSSATQLVFGIQGDPELITLEIKDNIGGVTVLQSPTITSDFQFWIIDPADIDNTDMSQLKELVFIVHDWSHGGAPAGEYTVHVGGLNFTEPPLSVDPVSPGSAALTILPGEPNVGDIAGTIFEQHSSTNFTMSYDVSVDPFFAAVLVSWPAATNLTAITEFVFGAYGDAEKIAVEFEDSEGGKTIVHLNGVTGSLQHWVIDASLINNLDSLQGIVFVVSDTLAGATQVGDVTVHVGGLNYTEPPLTADPVSPGSAPLTILPGEPNVGDIGGTVFELHSTTNFTMSYDVSADPFFAAVLVSWPAPTNLTAITEFVFGAYGDAEKIAVEFEDSEGGKTIVHLNGVTGTLQHWVIDASLIDNLDSLQGIVFVVSDTLAGATQVGDVTVHVGGLNYVEPPLSVEPVSPGSAPLTILPGEPNVGDIAGTIFEQHSSTNFTMSYDVSVDPFFSAVIVSWPGATNLTAITEFVFGAYGDAEKIAVEFEDSEGGKTIVHLNGVTGTLQHWVIDASLINNLDSLQGIVFVVSDTLAGANQDGDVTVHVGGLNFTEPPLTAEPVSPGSAPLTILPGNPNVGDIGGTVFELHSTTNFTMSYDVSVDPFFSAVIVSWPGATNLTAITEFVFGAYGDAEKIAVEFEDSEGGKTIVHLNGVTGSLQHWVIDASLINNLDSLQGIVFVVSDTLAGANQDGDVTVHVGGLNFTEPPLTADPVSPGSAPLTILPGEPNLGDIGGTTFEQHSSTNFTMEYNVSVDPFFSAVIVNWPAATNLTAITEFVFGAYGDAEKMAVEFEDSEGGKTIVHLSGVTGSLQHWVIDASLINNLDSLQGIVFVVSDTLAGANQDGDVTVHVGGLNFTEPPLTADPVSPGSAALTILPGEPVVGDVGGLVFQQHSSTNFTMEYNVAVDPFFTAVIVQWDQPTNLTAFSEFVFGAYGDSEKIAVEFEDGNGDKTVITLNGVTGSKQHWVIDASLIANLDSIKGIVFVVSDTLIGAGSATGDVTIYAGGLAFEDGGESIIPVAWLNAYDLPTDGSVDHVDLDGDTMTVWEEYVADTNPTNAMSYWHFEASANQPPEGEGYALSWWASSDRVYTVERTEDILLPGGGFVVIADNIVPGVTGVYEYIDEDAIDASAYAYRVQVSLPDAP